MKRRHFLKTIPAVPSALVANRVLADSDGFKTAWVHSYFEDDIVETLFQFENNVPDNGGNVNLLSYYIAGTQLCVDYYGNSCPSIYANESYITRLRTNKGHIVARNGELYLSYAGEQNGQGITSPQCVGLVRAVTTASGNTQQWVRGEKADIILPPTYTKPARPKIAPFSVIATFGSNGKYNYVHTCIYVGHDFDWNVTLVEQNAPFGAGIRRNVYPFSKLSAFHIVRVPNHWTYLRNT